MPQIIPIKELKDTTKISELCHASSEPIYITKNGYGDMVVMSMETYEATIRRDQIYKELEISERQVAEGKTRPAKEALADLRVKYEL
ncbi:MAG: type II toxin-antitoxin system Phd/YefM family antitoxin [Oribacterium sp.]|uniref:type II toxin-antitoxin system Phd/YefM family antitoxin n=1 Tax=unclassified Oribacterium TaxID=2629782 RepID=UPI002A772FFE|nr:type II toxin-antitoxin system Phd/YefM family antitoxin [Oribacterium sp.]MDY2853901.1 type II toxin-antitoxin system Phd/YefM family antitoxin [Oliverpabstia sp.]